MRRKDSPLIHLFPKIDPGTGKRWSLADQGKAALDEVCGALNSEVNRELRFHLRTWVEKWRGSGVGLKKLHGTLSEPEKTALPLAMRTIWAPTDGAKAEPLYVPDYLELEKLYGKERVRLYTANGKWKPTPEIEALCLFNLLTVIPICDKLAGPCPRCAHYYIKRRASQTVYCSRRCGNASTAVIRTAARLKAERAERVLRAKALIKEWNALKDRSSLVWKLWLREQGTDVTDKFVTRWVNEGKLQEPKQGRRK